MQVSPINANYSSYNQDSDIQNLTSQLGSNVQLPNASRNYALYNQPLVNKLVSYGDKAVDPVLKVISQSNNEKTVSEALYVLDRMIDAGNNHINKSYPVISKFNNTDSPTIQVLLAGIYRKTQIPDAFGPLCKMLVQDSIQPNSPYFDPTEEVGGAILSYLKNKSAETTYSNALFGRNTLNRA